MDRPVLPASLGQSRAHRGQHRRAQGIGAGGENSRHRPLRGVPATLLRAHAVHPIAAVQSEYSLWTRNPEIAVLDECRRLGVALVAFSPMGRGFLAGGVTDPVALTPQDLRRNMPRFAEPHFSV